MNRELKVRDKLTWLHEKMLQDYYFGQVDRTLWDEYYPGYFALYEEIEKDLKNQTRLEIPYKLEHCANNKDYQWVLFINSKDETYARYNSIKDPHSGEINITKRYYINPQKLPRA